MRPYGWRVTCAVCGAYQIVVGPDWVNTHLNMRTHVREAHAAARKDLWGDPVPKGYGWTDNQVAVLPLATEEIAREWDRDTKAIIKEQAARGE